MGKKDSKGNLITSYEGLNNLYLNHYTEVLKNREMVEPLKPLGEIKESLWEERLKIITKNKTP